MPITIPASWRRQINRIHGDKPFVWLWEIEADQTPTARTVFRLVAYPEEITITNFVSAMQGFGAGGDGTPGSTDDGIGGGLGKAAQGWSSIDLAAPGSIGQGTSATFYPFPLAQSEINYPGDGSLVTMTLTADNTSRTLSRWFQKGEGFTNKRAVVYLVLLSDLTVRTYWTFRIAAAVVTAETASLRLETPNYFKKVLPENRFDHRRCGHAFGRAKCGYIVSAVGAFTDCGKTLTDCIARGDDMVSRNLPRNGPRNFGGFPGVPQP